MERSPSSAKTCLARARRERGQNRVPLPPARITGRKSTDFGIEVTSYSTETTFAQCGRHILSKDYIGYSVSPQSAESSSSQIAEPREQSRRLKEKATRV